MLLLLLNLAVADCDPGLTSFHQEMEVSSIPVLLVEDMRWPSSQDTVPIQLTDSDGRAVSLEAGEAYCTLGRTVTYAFRPTAPLEVGAEYSFDIPDRYGPGSIGQTPITVVTADESPPTEAPTVTGGLRNPQPGESPTCLDENEFVWRLPQNFPSLYAEYQVADATGQVHVFAATGWSWIGVGSSYCEERWPGLTDDTVLFLRARYLNSSGQSGPWSAWVPTENADEDVTLPAEDATIDCGDPPEPPVVDDDPDTEVDSDSEEEPGSDADSDSDSGSTVSSGCTTLPTPPAGLWALLTLLVFRRRRA